MCENAFVFRYFPLGLIIRVKQSTITERVRSSRNGYFKAKRVRKPCDQRKCTQVIFEGANGQFSQRACQGKAGSKYFRRPQRSYSTGFEIPSVGWKYFSEPRHWLEII